MNSTHFDFATDPAFADDFNRASENQRQGGAPPEPQASTSTGSTAAAGGWKGPPPLPVIVPGTWIAKHEPVIPDELVHNLLHRGCKMVLGGGSKSFKTWCLADLAISISSGSPWWGLDTVQGTVVYLNFEIQEGFFHDRLRRIAAAKHVALSDNLQVWNLRGFSQPAEELVPNIVERLKDISLAAIVIDPIYKLALGKDENATKDQGPLLNELEKLAVQTDAAVIYGHHFSKGNQAVKESMDRMSGAGVHARDPDAILTMTRHSEDNAFTVEATLRNCPTLPPFAIRWDFPLMIHAPDLDPAALKQAKMPNAKRTFTADDIVAVMPMGESLKVGQWQKLASDECGVQRSRFYELKAGIEADGHPKITRRDGTYTRIS